MLLPLFWNPTMAVVTTSGNGHAPSSKISRVDKEILKVLLDPRVNISTQALAKQVGVPLSTVQRRRKRLEERYLDISYSLRLSSLGYRRVDFFVHTAGGNAVDVGLELLKRKEVVFVGRCAGDHTIDLRVEAIVRDNGQVLDLLEAIKGLPNVRDVIWSELVDVIGRKKSVPPDVIDSL